MTATLLNILSYIFVGAPLLAIGVYIIVRLAAAAYFKSKHEAEQKRDEPERSQTSYKRNDGERT